MALIRRSTSVDLSTKVEITEVGYFPIKPTSLFEVSHRCSLRISETEWCRGYLCVESSGASFGYFEDLKKQKETNFGFLTGISGVLKDKMLTLRFNDGSSVHLKVFTNFTFLDVFETGQQFIRSWEAVGKSSFQIFARFVNLRKQHEGLKPVFVKEDSPTDKKKSHKRKLEEDECELAIKRPRMAPKTSKPPCKKSTRRRKVPAPKVI